MIPHVIPHNRPTIDAADIEAVSCVLGRGQIAQGAEVRAFEEELSARFRPEGDAVVVSSGTAALYLALRVLGVGPRGRVLLPTCVCTALVHATTLCGAEPVLADVRDSDFNLVSVADAPDELRAVVLPHLYGVPSDPARFRRLGVPVLEDAAQAIGASWEGRAVGGLGDASIFSFYATKPLTCGQGGAVLGSRAFCDEVRDLRDYDGKAALRPRFNFQMTDFQAALGRSQLRRLDAFLERRRAHALSYDARRPAGVGRQQGEPGAKPNHFRYVIRLRGVEAARARFDAAGVTTIVPTEPWELLHRQLELPRDAFPVAERIAQTTLSLPMQPSLSDDERARVAETLASLGDLA